ncbi:hypothetical protein Hte_000404 [Hypoxylon texense]
MDSVRFGIEIEVIVEPHTLRSPLIPLDYYKKLVASLRKRGQKAQVDDMRGGYRTNPQGTKKWWITRDGSLNEHDSNNQVAFEAVSPTFRTTRHWEDDIDAFWNAMGAVFHQPIRSSKCGSHVHISPAGRHYSIQELKVIAFGVVAYEHLVLQILPSSRHDNIYCVPNTTSSSKLGNGSNLERIGALIASARSAAELKDMMQVGRRVIWNFENTLPGKTGTIEFRGGRGLRGRNRTRWWIAFALSFIHFVIKENDFLERESYRGSWRPTVKVFYKKIRSAARDIGVESHLPTNYRVLNETKR